MILGNLSLIQCLKIYFIIFGTILMPTRTVQDCTRLIQYKAPLNDYFEVFAKKRETANDLILEKNINFITFFAGMFIKLLYDLLQKNPPLKLRMMDFKNCI